MAWDSCRQEVEKSGDKMCDVNKCAAVQAGVDHRCHDKGWPAGTPFGIYSDSGELCFCCCSCLAYGTPIETTVGSYKAIQDLIPGDEIRVSDLNGNWATGHVDWSSGISTLDSKTMMIMIRYNAGAGEQTVIATDDHVFLTYDKKLVPAGVIHPTDKLMGANGSPVEVLEAHPVDNYTGGVHNISTGPFSGDVNGHLINANGLVIADQSIKVAAMTNALADGLLVEGHLERPRVGTEAYYASVSEAAKQMLTQPESWPAGVALVTERPLFNIPPKADSFLTDAQARLLRAANTPRRPVDSNAAIDQVGRALTYFRGFYPDMLFVLDWGNPAPNGWAFRSFGETWVVLSGSLARIALLSNNGVSAVLSHLIARLRLDATSGGQGTSCVGLADYEAFGGVFTAVYDPLQFPTLVPAAFKEIKALFGLIHETSEVAHSACKNPTLDCRLAALWAGATLDPLPSCADPDAEGFQLLAAEAGTEEILVTFNNPVDPDSAGAAANYTLSDPNVEVRSATVDAANPAKVRLAAVVPAKTVLALTVANVTSSDDVPLEPGHNNVPVTFAG